MQQRCFQLAKEDKKLKQLEADVDDLDGALNLESRIYVIGDVAAIFPR